MLCMFSIASTVYVCIVYVKKTKYMTETRPSGFLQVGKLEKVREFEWSGKGERKYFFGKLRENEKLVPRDVRFSG